MCCVHSTFEALLNPQEIVCFNYLFLFDLYLTREVSQEQFFIYNHILAVGRHHLEGRDKGGKNKIKQGQIN